LRNVRSNALASYVVLVCRPRPESAAKVPFRAFDGELRDALRVAIHELQEASTAPVDLAQAVVGRGMNVFSKYHAVIAADGSQLTVAAALKHISDVRSDMLDEQKIAFDADTQFAVEWYEQYAYEAGPFGKADALARTKNIGVDGLVSAGIAESGGGRFRLLPREELRDGWDPATDSRLTTWESALYLVRSLEADGELTAGRLLAQLPDRGTGARDLAYRVFATAERRGQAEEARAFNAFVLAWPELDRLGGNAITLQQTMEV
jgi:putative DNA methylase